MTIDAPSPERVLEAVDDLGPPGTPVTTPEVAADFDCTDRTIYNRLDALVENGPLETKKVGAKGRVWWRPVDGHVTTDPDTGTRLAATTFRRLFENVPGRYLVVEPDDYEIVAVSDAYLEATTTERTAIVGKTLFEVFPADPDDPDPEGAPRLRASLERVKAERRTDVMPVTYYPIPRPGSDGDGFEDRWWTPTNSPVVGESGDVDYIVHRVEDVTPVVRRLQADGDETVLDRLDTRDSRLATDIVLRGRELYEAKERAYDRLRERTDLDAFRVDLADAIRPLSDPVEIQHEAARVLGERLDVDRAHYGVVLADGNTNVVHADHYRDGTSSVVGEHCFDDYGAYIADAFRAGETLVVDDYTAVPDLGDDERAMYEARDIGAFVGVPLVKDGRLAAYKLVAESEPRAWTAAEVAMVEETAERTWAAVERTRAEQALEHTNDALERLTTASRELMDVDPAAMCDRVAELTLDVLAVEHAALWRYDGTTGELEEAVGHTDAATAAGEGRYPDGLAERVWRTFVAAEPDVCNDLAADDRGDSTATLRSIALVPLGRHGVVCAGSLQPGTFDERTVDLAEALGATIEAAWDRAEGERRLTAQNEELQRLDTLNSLIRTIDQALVAADTRESIEETVCEHLAASERYEFAWIAEYDAATDTVRPQAWAGVTSTYLHDRAVAIDGASADDPLVAAIRTRERQVVADVATNVRAAPWREGALERGARSCINVPLVYEQSLYGVLTVYGGTPNPDAGETAVLAELGRTTAHAINAVETKATLRADGVVELTLRTETATDPLSRLARTLGGAVEFEGLVPGAGDEVSLFFTVDGVPTDDVVAAAARTIGFEDLTTLADAEPDSLYRVRVTDPTFASLLVDHGAVVRSLTVDGAATTATVDLFHPDGVAGFLDEVRRFVPDLELLARRTRTRPLAAHHTLPKAVGDRLTARQREVIETAYRSGFFRSPRVRTGRDLADSLGIAPSTFSHHLREAERKLCDLVFDADERVDTR